MSDEKLTVYCSRCRYYATKVYDEPCNNCAVVIDSMPTKFESASEFDQTVKADAGKAKLTLVPRKMWWKVARVREYGTNKYGDPDNWKRVEIERYRDAAFRHFLAYLDDPKSVDEESGLPHLDHLACDIAFLEEMEDWDAKSGEL